MLIIFSKVKTRPTMSHNKLNYLEILHKNGYRLTRQRQAILEAACQTGGHTPIRNIYLIAKKLDGGIDRSTVYRTLELFVKLGFVNVAENLTGERTYEIVQETQHHHLICKTCGGSMEIDIIIVNDFYQQIEQENGYHVDRDHLILYGLCPQCKN